MKLLRDLSAGFLSLSIMVMVVSCQSTPSAGPQKTGIGVLIQNRPLGISNPSEYRLPDGILYAGAAYRIDGVNVVIEGQENVESFVGKLVIFTYTVEYDLNRLLKPIGTAPADYGDRESMQQLRSDWTADETGFSIGNSTPERLAQLSWLKISSISALEGFSITTTADSVQVSYKNPFDKALEALSITAHYEGGRGKPSPRYETKTIPSLATGQSGSERFALSLPAEGVEEGAPDKGWDYTFQSIIFEMSFGGQDYQFEIFSEGE